MLNTTEVHESVVNMAAVLVARIMERVIDRVVCPASKGTLEIHATCSVLSSMTKDGSSKQRPKFRQDDVISALQAQTVR